MPHNILLPLRHTLSILLLPFMVVVVIPCLLLFFLSEYDHRWVDSSFITWMPRIIGFVVFAVGLLLFCWCLSLFARVGKGTLAPWDPTQNLVAVGPYCHVRNPMISGVALMLVGHTLFWGSWLIGAWTCFFALINHLYFILSEEPGLEDRFGEIYRIYKATVPRWIPRLKSWSGE